MALAGVVPGILILQRYQDRRAAMHTWLVGMKPPQAMMLQWHAVTGDLARAFALAGTLRAQDKPPNLAFDPMFDALRAHQR